MKSFERVLSFIRILGLSLIIFCMTGCMYSNVRLPLDTDVNKTELGAKVGRSSSYSVAHLVAWGDSGIAAAADNGQIKTIHHLDTEVFNIFFGLYTKVTTVAYGD